MLFSPPNIFNRDPLVHLPLSVVFKIDRLAGHNVLLKIDRQACLRYFVV